MKRIMPFILLLIVILMATGCPDPDTTSAYQVLWQMLDASTKQVIIQKGDIVADQMGIGSGAQGGFIPGSGQAGYVTAIQISLPSDSGVNSPVSANWAYNTSEFDIEDGTKLYQKVFIPKKAGRFVVRATVDGAVLSIPINVYPAIGLNVDGKWGNTAGLAFGASTALGVAAGSAELYINAMTGSITAINGILEVDGNSLNPYEPLMHQLLNSGSQTYASRTIIHDDLMDSDAWVIRAANGRTIKLRFYNMTGDPIGQAKLIYLIADTNNNFAY